MKNLNLILAAAIILLVSCGRENIAPQEGQVYLQNENLTSDDLALVASQAINVSTTRQAYFSILDDAFGYNTRFPDTAEPWSSDGYFYADKFSESFANNLRYPGGTVANYWDAFNHKLFVRKHSSSPDRAGGWVDAAKLNSSSFVHDIIRNDLQKENTLADLASVVSRSGASVVFVLNMVTPGRDFYASPQGWNRPVNDHPGTTDTNDDWYKMLDDRFRRMKKMLRDAQRNNIPVKLVQLGNELYWGGDAKYHLEAFPNGQAYARACNYIVTKLRNDADLNLPASVKFAIVGCGESVAAGMTRVLNWNEQVFSTINANKFSYATIHNYADIPQITTFDDQNVKQNVVNWIEHFNEALVATKAYNHMINTGHWRIFYSELRANPKQPSVWGRCLMEVYGGLHVLNKAGTLYMQPNFDNVVNVSANSLRSRAYAFMPLMRASKGANQAAKIIFSGSGKMPGSTRNVVQGFAFKTPGGNRRCAIVSFSENAFNLDLTSVFGSKTVKVSGQTNTLNANGQPTHIDLVETGSANVVMPPYSILFVRE